MIACSALTLSCSTLRVPDQSCYVTYDHPAVYSQEVAYAYYRYTADGVLFPAGVVETKVGVGPVGAKWVKKKADENCLSANPEDCLVWCLVEGHENYQTVLEVIDTALVTDFVADTIWKEVLVDAYTEEVEVICQDKITPQLAIAIHDALDSLGVSTSHIMDRDRIGYDTYDALSTVQEKYDLPVGDLDVETLEFLGISWNE